MNPRTTITLSPYGPHSPDYTRQVADAIADAAQVLNHATYGNDGLGYPSDVYAVVGSLQRAVSRLAQTLNQLDGWLQREADQGRAVEHPDGPFCGDTSAALRAYARATEFARVQIYSLCNDLDDIHDAVSWMEARP